MTVEEFMSQKEDMLITAHAILEAIGASREAEIIKNYKVELKYHDIHFDGNNYYSLCFKVPYQEYKQLKPQRKQVEMKLKDIIDSLYIDSSHKIAIVWFLPTMERQHVNESLETAYNQSSVNNQGRVRSSNPAAIEADGLHFRSYPEIKLYKAFKLLGIVFAPLPVFLKGGKRYERYEPDFFLISAGRMVIVEVDGEEVHAQRASYDSKRAMMFEQEGVNVIRVKASDCLTKTGAMKVARRIVRTIKACRLPNEWVDVTTR